jgi:hypothetical protein
MKPLLTCFAFVLFSITSSWAGISWNVVFGDITAGNGTGFDDPVEGLARRNTFLAVTDYVSSQLAGNGTIDFDVTASEIDGTGFLASAGTYYFIGPNGFSNGILYQHAVTGVDPTGSVEDATATFDFGYNWNTGITVPSGSQFDLFTVALHEVTHALGFASLVTSSGISAISGGNPGVFSVYDSFLELGNGTPLFSAAGGASFTATVGDFTSNDVFFSGANAMAANGGNPVKVFAPPAFQDGSSISHVDSSFASAVMTPSIAPGVTKRSFTAIDLGVLQDIGWTPIPEPNSALLFGLASLLFVRRRR